MPGRDDIPAIRMRSRQEMLIGLADDSDDESAELEGYDSSQRAEILEVMMDGPDNGDIQTGLFPDSDGTD